jgi:tRNA-specific adenosine deaminase 1
MELTMAAQEDSTPWALPTIDVLGMQQTSISNSSAAQSLLTTAPTQTLVGRGYFSHLGAVRRKPSRPDAPPTLSKSCSDKLAHTQCTSLLLSLTSILISPRNIYLTCLILPESQNLPSACSRAFSSSGRMAGVARGKWDGGYAFHEIEVKGTSFDFEYSRRQILGEGEKLVSSNISASWINAIDNEHSVGKKENIETLIGGILQGRKQGDIRGASRVCRKNMWKLAINIEALMDVPAAQSSLAVQRYGDVKESILLEERQRIKRTVREKSLMGWVSNNGDEEFDADDARMKIS